MDALFSSSSSFKDVVKERAIAAVDLFITACYNEPHHVIIESGLAMFIIWLVFIRKTVNPKLEAKNKLTTKEQEWLIETWQPEVSLMTLLISFSSAHTHALAAGALEPASSGVQRGREGGGQLPHHPQRAHQGIELELVRLPRV